MVATTLKQALNLFDPMRPLTQPEELERYYVPRPLSPIHELRALLENVERPQKVLFSGHTGCGKTTELAKLASELGPPFFVVNFSVKTVTDIGDLTYVDVVLAMALELFRAASERKVGAKEELLELTLDYFQKEIVKEEVTETQKGGGIGARLDAWVVSVEGRLRREAVTRTTVRKRAEPLLSQMVEHMEGLVRDVELRAGRRVLLVVEDLDKVDLERAQQIFWGHHASLTAPPCSVIFTFPEALRHHPDYIQIENLFEVVRVLPNFNLCQRDGTPDPEGHRQLQEILSRRAHDRLFGPGAREALVGASGGVPRVLLMLARRACLQAMVAGGPRIAAEAAQAALQGARVDYDVLLDSHQRQLLRQVARTKRVQNDPEHRVLLHTLSALEYRNHQGVWYDVHPLVWPLLEETP